MPCEVPCEALGADGGGHVQDSSTDTGATAPSCPPDTDPRMGLTLKVFYSSSSAVSSQIHTPHHWDPQDGPEPLLLAPSGGGPFSVGTAGVSPSPCSV